MPRDSSESMFIGFVSNTSLSRSLAQQYCSERTQDSHNVPLGIDSESQRTYSIANVSY